MLISYQFIRSLKTLQPHEMQNNYVLLQFEYKWCLKSEREKANFFFIFYTCFSLFLVDVTSFIFICLRLMYIDMEYGK